ncbi:MAG: A/G-specific adenine glycosylase [Sulfobacillus sp.]
MRGTKVLRMPAFGEPSFVHRLLDWYRQAGRDLPWRQAPTAYQVVVSELMLQQTTVATALIRYPRFLQAFPDFLSLAGASEDEVVAEWAGLGYYQRARHLSRLARRVVAEGLPRGESAWRQMPGVGPYTAAAIAAFAEGGRALAIDVNVRRTLSRLFAFKDTPQIDAAIRAAMEPFLLPDSGELNQALIELGALICRPARPHCDRCPLAQVCAGRDQLALYGRPPAKPAVRDEFVHLVAVRRAGQLLVRQRTTRLLQGLWGLPQAQAHGHGLPDRVQAGDVTPTPVHFTHRFTHRRWQVQCTVVDGDGEGRWIDPRAPDVALAGPDRRAIQMLVAGGFFDAR